MKGNKTNELSDDELIEQFHKPKNINIVDLFTKLAGRAATNTEIKLLLFDLIKSPEARKKKVLSFIKYSWHPIIPIVFKGTRIY